MTDYRQAAEYTFRFGRCHFCVAVQSIMLSSAEVAPSLSTMQSVDSEQFCNITMLELSLVFSFSISEMCNKDDITPVEHDGVYMMKISTNWYWTLSTTLPLKQHQVVRCPQPVDFKVILYLKGCPQDWRNTVMIMTCHFKWQVDVWYLMVMTI